METDIAQSGVTKIVDPALVALDITNLPQELIKPLAQLQSLYALRSMSADDWVETHGSGTLRKNKRIGFAWKAQYREERAAYEFGWTFEVVPASRVMWGIPFTEGDCHAVTEAGWHIERFFEKKVFIEDFYEAKYIKVEYPDGATKEGIGIVVRQTSAKWVGEGQLVFAIVAEFVPGKGWKEAENPF
jgi:hypothetical protein